VKNYKVKEIFYSLAGEGFHVGRPTVFVRFTGCNLWSGREEDRGTASCSFCDTDFNGMDGPFGGIYSGTQLMTAIKSFWPQNALAKPYVVFTGGEPSLQLDDSLVEICHESGWEVGIETNGSRLLPKGLDWICVSPKGEVPIVVERGNELKLVYPQTTAKPESFVALDFEYFYLQPLWDREQRYWREAAQFCLQNPRWRLSLQTHKILGLP
jgi:7-carboxy-7-deazaguanine synthase